MHKIDRPCLINLRGCSQRLGALSHETTTRFDTQTELQLAVDAVDAFVIPFESFYVAKI